MKPSVPTPRPWTVLPHGPLVELESNLRVVEGSLPSGHVPRRMTVVRLHDGRLLFHNAIPLGEPEMKALEAWGLPAILFVPNALHRLDLHAYKQRYPKLLVLCPALAREKVGAVVPVDGTTEDFPVDPFTTFVPLQGSKVGEAVLRVSHAVGASLAFGDTIMNLVRVGGLDGLVFKLIGSIGPTKVTPLTRLLIVSDRRLLSAHLDQLAATPGLSRLIPSHGEIVEAGAAQALRRAAAGLA